MGDAAKALLGKLKQGGAAAWQALGSEKVISGRNLVQSALGAAGVGNPLSRPMFPGERHIVSGPGAQFPGSQHNFTGPGTQLAARLARGDRPVNAVDAVSQRHDVDYSMARTPADVREADQRAIAGWRAARSADPRVADFAVNVFRGMDIAKRAQLVDPMAFAGSGAEQPLPPGGDLRAFIAKAERRKARRSKRK